MAGFDQNHDFVVYDNGGTRYVTMDGSTERVGIGTSTPQYKLDVIGDTRIQGTLTTEELIISSSKTAIPTES